MAPDEYWYNTTTGTSLSLYALEDSSRLYLCIKANPAPSLFFAMDLYLDPNNHRGSLPQSDDFMLTIYQGSIHEQVWAGSSWVTATENLWTADSTLACIEVAIDYAKLGIVPGVDKTMGISIDWMDEDEEFDTPSGFSFSDPSTWGSIVSTDHWGVFGPQEVIDIKYGGIPVTADGISSPGEWSDAEVPIDVTIGSGAMRVHTKEDGSRVHLGFEMTSPQDFKFLRLYMDPFNGDQLSTESVLIDFQDLEPNPKEYNWDGSTWLNVPISDWSGAQGDGFIEISINYSKFAILPGFQKNISMAFRATTQMLDEVYWHSLDVDQPNTWGIMSSTQLWAIPNRAPILESGTVDPSSGVTDDLFEYSVVFDDPDGDDPVIGNLIIDGIAHSMEFVKDTGSGAKYNYSIFLGQGDHSYRFSFSDGEFIATYPATGELMGPTVYAPNEPPFMFRGPIPNNTYFMDEDQQQARHLIDLNDYFTDDQDASNLAFKIIYQEDTSIMEALVDGSYLDFDLKAQDWHGQIRFQVKAEDNGISGLDDKDHHRNTSSNIFSVSVRSIEDIPIIESVNHESVLGDIRSIRLAGEQGASEDTPFTIEIKASDPDMMLDPYEDLSFWVDDDSLSLEKTNRWSATMTFTPDDGDVGWKVWNFTVTDGQGESDTVEVAVEVANIADEPFIDHCTNGRGIYPVKNGVVDIDGLYAIEDERFYLKIIGIDDDGRRDKLTFGLINSRNDITLDPESGELLFYPDQEDVGIINISISVTDRTGLEDIANIFIPVINVNDPPAISSVVSSTGSMVFEKGEDAYVTVFFSDSDIGYDPYEKINIEWSSDIDGILGHGEALNITLLESGSHNVTVTITDRLGDKAEYSFRILVNRMDAGTPKNFIRELLKGSAYAAFPLAGIVLSIVAFTVYSRIQEKSVLDNVNRKIIFEAIKRNSGIRFMALSEEVSLAKGVLAHHLNILEKNKLIRSLQDGNYRLFYLYDDRIDYKLSLTTIQQAIVFVVKQDPGITQSGISEKMGKSKMVINYHIKILKDVGLLSIEKNGRETNCFPTSSALDLA